MVRTLTHTTDALAPLLIRIALGVVIFAHGAQKALGWFGGGGWSGTVDAFTGYLGVPAVIAVLVILGEFLGSIGLITGTLTRVAAAGIAVIMVGAILIVHAPFGFFMNWSGAQGGEGIEFGLLATAMAVSLVLTGAGRWSVDEAIAAHAEGERALTPETAGAR
jgi:putative oxidoreductase